MKNAIDVRKTHIDFLEDLNHANNGKQSTLPFIKNFLSSQSLIKDNEIFQVLGIGGSVYRRAFVKKEKDTLYVLDITSGKLPKFLTKEDLFTFLEKLTDPHSTHLAINFAYPLEPVFEYGRLDGILVSPSKEHQFVGLIGKKVGYEFEQYMYHKHKRKIVVSLANDTICLILSGLTKTGWDNLAAGIVGTGVNMALFLDEKTVVNLEAGNFARFDQTRTGKLVDIHSANPGKQLFEKEVSGAYLYQHINHLIQEQSVNHPLLEETRQLSIIAQRRDCPIFVLAQEHLQRSAAFFATQIAGVLAFQKKTTHICYARKSFLERTRI